MEYSSFPLSWPLGWKRTPLVERQSARFSNRTMEKSSFSDSYFSRTKQISISGAIDRLMREVRGFTRPARPWRIDPDRVVVSTNIRTRLDGLPYSSAKEPEDSGVAVYFKFDGKDQVLACDKWNRVADNLAAIAAHLGALRGQERWGVGSIEQAFAGYVALNEKTEPTCFEVLGISGDATELQIMDAYRRKARETHPDNGGTAEEFSAVVRAKDIALAHRKQAA
jgi:hypothetical protein